MTKLVVRLLERARHTGFRRGFVGSSRPWLIIWAVLASARLVRRFVGPKPEVVFKGELRPGQALLVSHDAPVEVVSAP